MAHPARLTSHLLARTASALPVGRLAADIDLARALPGPEVAPPRPRAPEPRDVPPQSDQPRARRPEAADRVKMTVRLDPDRHDRLRILAARRRCTSQDIMIRALDAYVGACSGDCACLGGPSERRN